MKKQLFTASLVILAAASLPFVSHIPVDQYTALAQTYPTGTQNQTQKLQQLDINLGEHAILAGQMTIARYNRTSEFIAAKKAVDNNTTLIANQIEQFYDTDTKDRFSTIWNAHIDAFNEYADGKHDNNTQKMDDAMHKLQTFTGDIASLLSQKNSGIDFTAAQNYFAQHVMDEKAVLDAYADKNYGKMYDMMHEAYMHATSITSTLMQ